MPVDTSVILGYKPVELQNPLAAYGQIAQLQNAQNQNALAQYQLSSAQRKDQDYNRLRGVLGGFGADTPVDQQVNALAKGGFLDEARKLAESHAKVGADKRAEELSAFNLAEKRHGAYQSALQGLAQKPDLTKADAIAAAQDLVQSGQLPQSFLARAAGLPDDPVALRGAIMQDIRARMTPEQIFTVFAPKPVEVSTGGRKFMRDAGPNSPTYGQEIPGTSIAMEQTPDSMASITAANERARLQRAQAESHFKAGESAPQYMMTEGGVVALPKKPAAGAPIVGTPVMGTDGQPLVKPLPQVPATAAKAMNANNVAISRLDRAIALLEGTVKEGDKEATGMKGYLPDMILNRAYPEGTETRAEIADIGSLKLHDRSGAAVTASEFPRLKPFIPLMTDDPSTALTKLKRMRAAATDEANGLKELYGSGYKPMGGSGGKSPSPAQPAATKSGATVSNW